MRTAEIWFRPNPWLTFEELSATITEERLVATPRLGRRDQRNPKGYRVRSRTVLRLYDAKGKERLVRKVKITAADIRKLWQISGADLEGCEPCYRGSFDVEQGLAFYEQKPIAPATTITIVRFKYERR